MSKAVRAASLAAACISSIIFSILALSACSTTGQASNVQQRVAAACPVVQVAVADVQALGSSLSPDVQAKVAAAAPVVAQVCAGNATIDTASLASLVQTGLPALIADVTATSLSDADKAKVTTALALAQIALTAVVQLAPQPTASVTTAPQ